MNIYQCSQKKMKKFIKAFRKTEYGRTVFCLAYSVPIIGLMLLLITMFSLIIWKWCWYFFFLSILIPFLLFLVLISFVIGSAYYYRELREYILITSKKEEDK